MMPHKTLCVRIVSIVLAPLTLPAATQVATGEMCLPGGSGLADPLIACFAGATIGAGPTAATGGVTGPVAEDGEVIGIRPDSIAHGEVEVVYGRASHSGNAEKPTEFGFDLVRSTTESVSRDQITISAPGLNGTAGTLTALMSADVEVTALSALSTSISVTAFVEWIAVITIDSHGWFFSGQDLVSHVSGQPVDGPNYTGDPLGLLGAPELSFVFGTPFDLRIESRLVAHASTGGHGTVAAVADALYLWSGIAGVFDASGAPVANYSLSFAANFDWASAVPLPPSIAFLVAPLVVGFFRVRT